MLVLPLDPQYVHQISARSEHAYASYSNFCKVCEMNENLLTQISGTAKGILLKFETWPPLYGHGLILWQWERLIGWLAFEHLEHSTFCSCYV